MANVPHKTCVACNTVKPLSEFYLVDRIRQRYSARCKPCRIVQAAEYKHAHRDQYRGYNRVYRKRYAEKLKAGYSHEKRATRYAVERDANIETSRRWRKENPDLKRAQKHRRRARLAENGGSYTPAEWNAIKHAQNYTCLACGRSEPHITLTVDHVVPISKGGTNATDNIQGLCVDCNNHKRTRTIDYRQ